MVSPEDQQVYDWMQELQPLQKVHYSWTIVDRLLVQENDPVLYEYARLTNAISLSGFSVTTEQIRNAVKACDAVNQTNPVIPCSLAINYSPWHYVFGPELPPTDTGPTHDVELQLLNDKFNFFKNELAEINLELGTDITLSAVLLDMERFNPKTGQGADDVFWNQSITYKYDLVYDATLAIFPGVIVSQHSRGNIHTSPTQSGWATDGYYVLDEKGQHYNATMYVLPEIGYMRETYRRTAANADAHGVQEIVAGISLGSGLRRQVDRFHRWDAWDYDLIYSWQMGQELNIPWFGEPAQAERFAPYNRAPFIKFFPEPFNNNLYPAWGKHFVAYVRGANNVNQIDDLNGNILG